MDDLGPRVDLLEAQVSSLERLVQFLMRLNGLDLSALRRAETADLLALYQDAVMLLALCEPQFDEDVLKRWAEIFLQLSEYELTRIKSDVGFDHTWQPFYQLCSKMMTHVRQKKDFTTSLNLQHIYMSLDRGRKNLRDSAIVLIQNASTDPPPLVKALLKEIDPKPPKK